MAAPDFCAKHTLDVEHRGRKAAISKDLEALKKLEVKRPFVGIDGHCHPDISVRLANRLAEANHMSKVKKFAESSDEMAYVMNAGPVLMKYYDMQRDADDASVVCHGNVKDSILKYFIPEAVNTQADGVKTQLMKDYERATKGDTLPEDESAEDQACSVCGAVGTTVVITNEALALCTNCDACEQVVVETERPPSKDTVKDSTAFCYKRLNHFNEWLSQIQGKQQTHIPDDVYDAILLELKKRKITNLSELTASQVKGVLKKLKLNKYYEHVAFVLNKLNGGQVKVLHPELENKLRTLFLMTQGPFLKWCPNGRKNYLSYSFVMRKLIELLGEDEYLDCCPLLKSIDKLRVQEEVWANICKDLGWQFIPSV